MTPHTPAWLRRENLFIVPPGGWVLVFIVLTAMALAGGRPLWAQGAAAMGIGVLWLVWPPAEAPSRPVVWVLGLLALLPLGAYLPAALFGQPPWRGALSELAAITPSYLVTPQPWSTLHFWLLWLAGLSLAAWCSAQRWDHYHRDTLARLYAGGFMGIVLFAIFGYSTGLNPALWQSTDGFGPFPNRNQWGSVLGMGGIIVLAILHQSIRRADKRGAIMWGSALLVITGAVVANGSRGGLLVLVGGCFAYGMFFGLMRKQYRYAAISVSMLLIFFAAFAAGGGALLERFVGTVQEGLSGDRRLEFYRMTLNMVKAAPLTGFGLGNFQYVFPFYLDYAPIADTRPVHPENSFIWLASEGGWPLVAAALAAMGLVIRLGYGARRSRATSIRAAGLACASVMVVNALFEVSAHRIGSLYPGILLASLALPVAAGARLARAWTASARVWGALLVGVGLVWFAALPGRAVLPVIQGTSVLREEAGMAIAEGDRDEAAHLLRHSARLLPLDWSAHWSLAALYLDEGEPDKAWNEFRAVEALLPYMDWILVEEGNLWLRHEPSRAAYAWGEALRRAPAGKRAERYQGLLGRSGAHPGLRAAMLRYYPDDPEFEFARMRVAGRDGVRRLPRLLAKTRQLQGMPDHLVDPVLSYMFDHGQHESLRELATGNPRLKKLGWKIFSRLAALDGDKEGALDLHFQHGPRPVLPAPISRSDLRSIERAAALAPSDIATAVAYYQALAAARRQDDAFWQLRRIMELPDAPPYIWYLAARTAHQRDEYEEAWEFLRAYEEKTKP